MQITGSMPLAYAQTVAVQGEGSPASRQREQPAVVDVANPSITSSAYQQTAKVDWFCLR